MGTRNSTLASRWIFGADFLRYLDLSSPEIKNGNPRQSFPAIDLRKIYSGLILAVLTTAPHLLDSDLMSAAKSAGVPPPISLP